MRCSFPKLKPLQHTNMKKNSVIRTTATLGPALAALMEANFLKIVCLFDVRPATTERLNSWKGGDPVLWKQIGEVLGGQHISDQLHAEGRPPAPFHPCCGCIPDAAASSESALAMPISACSTRCQLQACPCELAPLATHMSDKSASDADN